MGRWSAERNADTLLRYLSPEIEWEFVGIDEHWREGVKVVFRKRSESKQCHKPRRDVMPPIFGRRSPLSRN